MTNYDPTQDLAAYHDRMIVECDACQGSGRHLVYYHPQQGEVAPCNERDVGACPHCSGIGLVEVETLPVEMGDNQMAVDQKVSKWMRKRGPMRDRELVAPRQRTVRDLMALRGWCLSVDDDSMAVGWIKVDSCGVVTAYSDADRETFNRDLAACQAELEG